MKIIVAPEKGDHIYFKKVQDGDAAYQTVLAICTAIPCVSVYLDGTIHGTINAFVDHTHWNGAVPVYYKGLKVGHMLPKEEK